MFSTVSHIMVRRVGSCTLTGGAIVPIYDAYLFLDVSCRVVVSLYIVQSYLYMSCSRTWICRVVVPLYVV